MPNVPVIGIYKLPAALDVTTSCFEKSIPIKLGSLRGVATLPKLTWNNDGEPRIVAPDMQPDAQEPLIRHMKAVTEPIERAHYWGSVSSWNPRANKALKCHLGAVAVAFEVSSNDITYSDYLYGKGHPIGPKIDSLFKLSDEWFTRLRSWVEAATDQDADPEAPINSISIAGHGLSVLTVEDGVVSLPATPHEITARLSGGEPINLTGLRRIFGFANAGKVPDDGYMLMASARAAFRRQNYRRAVIEGGTAIEIVLADFNRRVTHVALSGRPTLGSYVRESTIIAAASLPTNTQVDLVERRNNAIHNNIVPTQSEAKVSLELARRIIKTVDPLPI